MQGGFPRGAMYERLHTLDIAEAGAEADPAHPHPSAKALRALHELVRVLSSLPALSCTFIATTGLSLPDAIGFGPRRCIVH